MHTCRTSAGRLRHGPGAICASVVVRMDPQVADTYGDPAWFTRQYAGIVRDWLSAGDEIGVHPHCIVGRGACRLAGGAHGSTLGRSSHCSSFEAFHDVFQSPSYVYRMGDRTLNNPSVAETLGGRIDLSVEPGYLESPGIFRHELQTGLLPDYAETPRHPYQPSYEDFRRAEQMEGIASGSFPSARGRWRGSCGYRAGSTSRSGRCSAGTSLMI